MIKRFLKKISDSDVLIALIAFFGILIVVLLVMILGRGVFQEEIIVKQTREACLEYSKGEYGEVFESCMRAYYPYAYRFDCE